MKKIRSRKLFEFLQASGAIEKGDEAIAQAKHEYRKLYKKEHKRKRRKHEIRPLFTKDEYTALRSRALLYGIPPTRYVKRVVLSELSSGIVIPRKEELLMVLQMMSRAINQGGELAVLLTAETMLLKYLTYDSENTDPSPSLLPVTD